MKRFIKRFCHIITAAGSWVVGVHLAYALSIVPESHALQFLSSTWKMGGLIFFGSVMAAYLESVLTSQEALVESQKHEENKREDSNAA